MSESVEVVRRLIDALARGDADAVIDACAPDVEIDFSHSRGPLNGVYRGHEEVRTFLTSFFEPWASIGVDTKELVELGDDRVLSVATIRTRGQGSGAEVDATGAITWTVRDGLLTASTMYQSKEEALEARSAER